jgi:hypothetical protein
VIHPLTVQIVFSFIVGRGDPRADYADTDQLIVAGRQSRRQELVFPSVSPVADDPPTDVRVRADLFRNFTRIYIGILGAGGRCVLEKDVAGSARCRIIRTPARECSILHRAIVEDRFLETG